MPVILADAPDNVAETLGIGLGIVNLERQQIVESGLRVIAEEIGFAKTDTRKVPLRAIELRNSGRQFYACGSRILGLQQLFSPAQDRLGRRHWILLTHLLLNVDQRVSGVDNFLGRCRITVIDALIVLSRLVQIAGAGETSG